MTKQSKILVAGTSAIAMAAAMGVVAPTETEASSYAPATVVVADGKVKLSWDSEITGPIDVKRKAADGTVSQIATGLTTSSYEYLITPAMGAAFKDVTANGAVNVTASTVDGDGNTTVTVAPQASLIDNAYTDTYIITSAGGYTEEVNVNHTLNADQILYKVVSGSEASSAVSNWETATALAPIKVAEKDIPNATLIYKLKDTETAIETQEVRVKMNTFSVVTGVAEITTLTPVITTSEELTSKTVDMSLELPLAWENIEGVKIFYTLNDGAPVEYVAGTKVTLTENARITAYIMDAHGNKSKIAEKAVLNVNPNFGEEYKLDLTTNMFTIIRPEGLTNVARYEYSINGSAFRIYSEPVKVADGIHQVEVRVVYVDGSVSNAVKYEYRVGDAAKLPTEDEKATAAYKELKDKATEAVVKAETDKTQASIDAATKALEGLTFTDRLILQQRLNVISGEMSTTTAALAVETAKTKKDVSTLVPALVAVGNLPDGDVKKLLQTELTPLTKEVVNATPPTTFNTAVDVLLKTAETKTDKGSIYALGILIPNVADSVARSGFESRYLEVKNSLEFAESFETAEKALKDAEASKSKLGYDKAADLISKLPAGAKTEELKKRLVILEKIVGVTTADAITRVARGEVVKDLDLAKALEMDLPSSVIPKISQSIFELGINASTINAQQVAELHIALDKAQRSLSSKSVAEYAKLYNTYSSLSTIKTFTAPQVLDAVLTSMSNSASYDSVIKAMATQTGIDEAKLSNYYKAEKSATILSYDEISKLEKVYEHKMFKSMLLATEYLVNKTDINKDGAMNSINALLNGEYKQALLTTMNAPKEDIEKAGVREDKVISKDAKEEEEKKPEVEENSDLTKYLATLGEDIEFQVISVKDPKAGDMLKLETANGHTFEFKAETGIYDYTFVVTPEGDEFIIKMFTNGKEVTNFKDGIKISFKADGSGKLVKVNGDGTYGYLNAKYIEGKFVFDVKELPLNVHLNQHTGSFTDIASHWSKEYVEKLVKVGIIQDSFAFFPNDGMTRGEFASYLATSLGLDTSKQSTFSDTQGNPYGGAIEALRQAGVVQGGGDNMFNPNSTINRQQAALMITRALSYKGINTLATNQPSFTDKSKIATSALSSVSFLENIGVFQGSPTGKGMAFNPTSTLTKSQMAKVLSNSIDYMHLMS